MRIWNSPTAMSMANAIALTVQGLLVVPFVLRTYEPATIALWALFSTIVVVQSLAAAGLNPTFVRAVAYAIGGARNLTEVRLDGAPSALGASNWALVAQIAAGMKRAYLVLGLASLVLLGSLGSILVARPIAATGESDQAWLAWGTVVFGAAVVAGSGYYVVLLESLGHVALIRRWDTLFALAGGVVASGTIVAGGNLLALVSVVQGILVLQSLRNRLLVRRLHVDREWAANPSDRTGTIAAIWPAAWRSSVGAFGIVGLNQASGIAIAQVGDPALVASYLLALRFLEVVSRLARSAFYPRLPVLSRLRAQGRFVEHVRVARRGMSISYWLVFGGVLAGAVAGDRAFRWIGSTVPFPSTVLWLALGTALLLERYGAMHLQLAGTANRIVSHKAMAGYVLVYLGTALALVAPLGLYAFPAAMLAGNVGWYSWYCAWHSYRALGERFWTFERALFVPPLTMMLLLVLLLTLQPVR